MKEDILKELKHKKEEILNEVIAVRVCESMYSELVEVCEENGITIGDVVRHAISRALEDINEI